MDLVKDPPLRSSFPSTMSLKDPCPYRQQIPSMSLTSKLYIPAGRQSSTDISPLAGMMGSIFIFTIFPELFLRVIFHEVSLPNLSTTVVTRTRCPRRPLARAHVPWGTCMTLRTLLHHPSLPLPLPLPLLLLGTPSTRELIPTMKGKSFVLQLDLSLIILPAFSPLSQSLSIPQPKRGLVEQIPSRPLSIIWKVYWPGERHHRPE
mmetsp:Transcript_29362/g.53739  ORF Transcript_29362/g.53739 Transcript_29362/m.53739 type:complete len:205 (-) Transcript_29362:208-822(-)